MRLLQANIARPKRLNLRAVKPQAPQEQSAPSPSLEPPTQEEVAFTLLSLTWPLLDTLVDRLDLVSPITGEPIAKVPAPSGQAPQLRDLASKILLPEQAYTEPEVLDLLAEYTQVTPERAAVGFLFMLQTEAIEITPAGTYFLGGSTPF